MYGGTKTEMERLLKDAEKFSGVKYDINNLSDVYKAIHVIQTELGITGTTAKEAANTISGSWASTKAAWQNLMIAMGRGEGVETAVNNLTASFGNVVRNVGPVLLKIVPSIGSAIWQGIKSGFPLVKGWLFELILGDDYTPEAGWGEAGAKIWAAIQNGFNALSGWLLQVVLGDDWTPESGWGEAGTKIWDAIKTGFSVVSGWLIQLVLGDDWTPESGWGEAGAKIWAAIKSGFAAVSGWLLKQVLGDDWTPESNWGTVGLKLWDAIKAGFAVVSGWLLKLVLGDDWTPESKWGDIGGKLWEAIKAGVVALNGWLLKLVLGDDWTPESGWEEAGGKIWDAILAGLASAGEWLKNLFDDWSKKLSDGTVDFSGIGEGIWGAITKVFEGAVAWFKALFGGTGDEDTSSVKGAIASIDWAGLGTSILGFIWSGWKGIGKVAKSYFTTAWNAVNNLNWAGLGRNMWRAIKKAFEGIKNWFATTFKAPINTVIGYLNTMLARVQEAINTMINGINEKLALHFEGVWIGWPINQQVAAFDWSPNIPTVNLGQVPLLAKGGVVKNGGHAIVGEGGYPEYLRVVNGQAIVTPMKNAAPAGGDSIVFNIYQQPNQNPKELADIVQRQLVQWEKQRRAAHAF